MKKLLFLLIATMFIFVACKKDPDPDPIPDPPPVSYDNVTVKVKFTAAPQGMVVTVTNFGLSDKDKVALTTNLYPVVPNPVADFTWQVPEDIAFQQWGKTVYVYVGACRSDGFVCYGQEEWLKIDKLGKTNEVTFVIKPF